ncbi:hypothetical protein JCM3765_006254 [Sporobolomyces pararoseus]
MNQPPSTTSQPAQEPSSATQTAEETPTEQLDKFESPESDAFRASKQASDWNSLLKWNRTTRLAQGGGIDGGWDYSTGQYHVPRQSAEYYSNVERLPADPNAPESATTNSSRHPTSVTISAGGDKDFDLSGDETGGGGSKGYHDSGRPKRSRQAMTRG